MNILLLQKIHFKYILNRVAYYFNQDYFTTLVSNIIIKEMIEGKLQMQYEKC